MAFLFGSLRGDNTFLNVKWVLNARVSLSLRKITMKDSSMNFTGFTIHLIIFPTVSKWINFCHSSQTGLEHGLERGLLSYRKVHSYPGPNEASSLCGATSLFAACSAVHILIASTASSTPFKISVGPPLASSPSLSFHPPLP
jgi:hypothetical protein